jgi:hypothetical protein
MAQIPHVRGLQTPGRPPSMETPTESPGAPSPPGGVHHAPAEACGDNEMPATTRSSAADGVPDSSGEAVAGAAAGNGGAAAPAGKGPRRFVGRRRAMQQRESVGGGSGDAEQALQLGRAGGARSRVVNAIPDEILNDVELNAAISAALPAHYNFEVHKTVWRAREAKAKVRATPLSVARCESR